MLRAFADGRMFGEVLGDLPVSVVGLHGWRRDRHDLEPVLHGLPAATVDLPGFGASPPPTEVWGAREYGAVLNQVLGELTNQPVIAVGHSFGGRVAVCAAAARPELFAGLVLTGVPLLRLGPRRRPPLRLRLARRAHSVGVIGEARVERLRERFGSDDYRNATGVMRGVLVRVVNESYEPELRALRAPVRMVWGADDTAAPVSIAEAARALVADASLEVLAGVGHDVPRLAPDRLRAAIDAIAARGQPSETR